MRKKRKTKRYQFSYYYFEYQREKLHFIDKFSPPWKFIAYIILILYPLFSVYFSLKEANEIIKKILNSIL